MGSQRDNIVDAHLIDTNGRILDRTSMGEDLFWGSRGGGGNSFGVVIAWKLNLVQVLETVTVFTVTKALDRNAALIFNRWKHVANKLPEDIVIIAKAYNPRPEGNTTRLASFHALFLGGEERLLSAMVMEEMFSELGLKKEDCREMNWIESVLYNAGYDPYNTSLDVFLDRTNAYNSFFKTISDYVKENLSEVAKEGLLNWFLDVKINNPELMMVLYGGRMDEICKQVFHICTELETCTEFSTECRGIRKVLRLPKNIQVGLEIFTVSWLPVFRKILERLMSTIEILTLERTTNLAIQVIDKLGWFKSRLLLILPIS